MVREIAYDRAITAACRHGHYALIEALVTAGADVNNRSTDCYTGMFDYYNNGAYWYKDTRGGRNNPGDSPLITAVRYGHRSCVEALIRLGADVNQTGQQSRTPLIEAVTQVLRTGNIGGRPDKSGAEVNVTHILEPAEADRDYYKYSFQSISKDKAAMDALTEGVSSNTRENIVMNVMKVRWILMKLWKT